DPRFANPGDRMENAEAVHQLFANAFLQKPAREWVEIIRERGRDLLFSLVNRPAELLEDPQAVENGYVTDWDHPAWGPTKWVGFPVQFSETPATLRTPAPEYGEHTEQVLLEHGYDWDQIAKLQAAEVI